MARYVARDAEAGAAGPAGQAELVLVLGRGEEAVAVLSRVGARPVPAQEAGGIRAGGACPIAPEILLHYNDVLWPLLRRTAESLGLSPRGFELAVTNASVASLQDRPLHVHGFSADLAVVLACLSAMLGAPLRPGVLATGHVAGPEGAVRMVASLARKIEAARREPAITTFLFPALVAGDAIEDLLVEEHETIVTALREARNDLDLVPIRSVEDAVRSAFTDADLVGAALSLAYFDRRDDVPVTLCPIPHLIQNLPERFWSCLEEAWREGSDSGRLLRERVSFHARSSQYPQGLGARLYRLLAAMAPHVREARRLFPLLDADRALALVKLAQAPDLMDARRFLDAVFGDRFSSSLQEPIDGNVKGPDVPMPSPSSHLQAFLRELDDDVVTAKVRNPIDTARATFLLDSVTAETPSECLNTAVSFSQHIDEHSGVVRGAEGADGAAGAGAALFERAFARRGGVGAAYAEATQGMHGRMRYVLDAVAEQAKAEHEEQYVGWVCKRMVDGLPYERRVDLVRELQALLRPYLAAEEAQAPPGRFVDDFTALARTYVRALGAVKERFRAV